MNPLYPAVAERAERRCEYCRAPEDVFNFPFEVEHLTPQARGGSDSSDNLALACHACNRFKSDYVTGIEPQTGQEVALFRPRQDVWSVHFRAEAETAQMIGLTAVGRATIMRLQMNRPQQVRARLHWIQLNLYP